MLIIAHELPEGSIILARGLYASRHEPLLVCSENLRP
jgi:hypothetical protein